MATAATPTRHLNASRKTDIVLIGRPHAGHMRGGQWARQGTPSSQPPHDIEHQSKKVAAAAGAAVCALVKIERKRRARFGEG